MITSRPSQPDTRTYPHLFVTSVENDTYPWAVVPAYGLDPEGRCIFGRAYGQTEATFYDTWEQALKAALSMKEQYVPDTAREIPRWDVQLAKGQYEDVGASSCEIDGGALVFRDQYGKIVLAYGPSQWLEVAPQ